MKEKIWIFNHLIVGHDKGSVSVLVAPEKRFRSKNGGNNEPECGDEYGGHNSYMEQGYRSVRKPELSDGQHATGGGVKTKI